MRVSLVVAVSRNGVIGRDGSLPWRVSGDLKKFKEITLGKPVIMGRKTWDSLPRKPLPGRLNIILSRRRPLDIQGATVASQIEDALAIAAAAKADEVCIIGGGEIYLAFSALADRIYLTRINADVDGDTVFPIDVSKGWEEARRETINPADGDTASAELVIYERVRDST